MEFTHPLTPSAREGESLAESPRARVGESNAKLSAREGEFLDCCFALLTNSADCHESATFDKVADSRNDESLLDSVFKTTEGFSVWLSLLLLNLGRETRLDVCERPKFSKSAERLSKDELPQDESTTR